MYADKYLVLTLDAKEGHLMGSEVRETVENRPLKGLYYGKVFFEKAEAYLKGLASESCSMMAILSILGSITKYMAEKPEMRCCYWLPSF